MQVQLYFCSMEEPTMSKYPLLRCIRITKKKKLNTIKYVFTKR